MRRINQSISVQADDSYPTEISWDGDLLHVEDLIKCWVYQTGWWNPEGGERRVYYRLKTDAGVVDVYRSGAEWTLARILD